MSAAWRLGKVKRERAYGNAIVPWRPHFALRHTLDTRRDARIQRELQARHIRMQVAAIEMQARMAATTLQAQASEAGAH